MLRQLGQPWEAHGGLWSGPGVGRSPQTSSRRTQVHSKQGKAGAPEHALLEAGLWREPWQRAAFAGTPWHQHDPEKARQPPTCTSRFVLGRLGCPPRRQLCAVEVSPGRPDRRARALLERGDI